MVLANAPRLYMAGTQQTGVGNSADWTTLIPVLKKHMPKHILSNPTRSHLHHFGFVRDPKLTKRLFRLTLQSARRLDADVTFTFLDKCLQTRGDNRPGKSVSKYLRLSWRSSGEPRSLTRRSNVARIDPCQLTYELELTQLVVSSVCDA
jgi:hypothetical protein